MKAIILLAVLFSTLSVSAADYYNNDNDQVPTVQIKTTGAGINIIGAPAKALFEALEVETLQVQETIYKMGKNITCMKFTDDNDHLCVAAFRLSDGQAIEKE